MLKKQWLKQNEKGLEQSNLNFVNLALYKEAKVLNSLQNLLNPSEKRTVSDTYSTLLNFEAKKAELLSIQTATVFTASK